MFQIRKQFLINFDQHCFDLFFFFVFFFLVNNYLRVRKSKAGDHSRRRPEGSLFNSYNTDV